MNPKTVSLRRKAFSAAALLASAILAGNASADYRYDTDTTVTGDFLLGDNEQFFLENDALLDSIAGSTFTSNRPSENGPGFVLESGTLSNISLQGSSDLVVSGTGASVTIDTVQGYTGATYLEHGDLYLLVDNALQSSSGIVIDNNSWLDIGNTVQDFQSVVILDGGLDGSTGSISSQTGFIVNQGASWVTLADSNAQGAAPASFTKIGSGTFYFEAQNTYTGDTNILEGALDMDGTDFAISQSSGVKLAGSAVWDMSNTSQTVGSLGDYFGTPAYNSTVLLGSGSLTTGLDDTDTTFSGNIIGSGNNSSVIKEGLGTWTFNGSAFNLDTFGVVNGALFINGYVDANVAGAVGMGGVGTPLIGGNGHIDTDIMFISEGVLMPGTRYTPGRLTVGSQNRAGHILIDQDGTLLIRVGSRHHFGNIYSSGTVVLDGNLLVTSWYGYRPTFRSSYTILHAEQGIVGSANNVNFIVPRTMLKPRVRQVDHLDGSSELLLTFEQQKFNGLRKLGHNQRALARSLDKEVRSGKINGLIDTLDQVDVSQVPNLIALLSPEQVSAVFSVGFSGARAQFNNIEGRLDTARQGNAGFCASGLSLSDSRGSLNYNGMPVLREDIGLSLAGFDGKSVVNKAAVAPVVEESRWGFFATGTGEWSDIESTNLARGSEFTTGGVTIGADYRVSNNLIVGLAGGYANTGSDLWDGGKVTLNSGKGNVYASLFNENAYVNASAGGAYNAIETRRRTLGGMAKADANAGEFDAMLGGGYDFHLSNGFTFGPVASLQYTYLNLNSYREHGSDAPMEFPTQSQDSLRSSLGLRAAYGMQVGGIVLTPEVRAQWAHEYLDSTAAVVSQFVGASSTFVVNGPKIGRDSLVLDAGISAQLNANLGVFAYYTGEIGRTNYSSNSVNGGFRISF